MRDNSIKIDFCDNTIQIEGTSFEIQKIHTLRLLKLHETGLKAAREIPSSIIECLKRNFQLIIKNEMIKDIKMNIELRGKEFVLLREYRVPLAQQEKVGKHLNELLNNKIIRKSTSNYSSPAFIIPKSRNAIRIVVNHKKLNEITIPIYYPLPSAHNNFHSLYKSKIFSNIDRKWAIIR